MHVYICIDIYNRKVYIYICMYIAYTYMVHIYIYIYIYRVRIYKSIFMYICIYMYIHICIFVYVCDYVCVCIYVYTTRYADINVSLAPLAHHSTSFRLFTRISTWISGASCSHGPPTHQPQALQLRNLRLRHWVAARNLIPCCTTCIYTYIMYTYVINSI